MTFNDVKNRFKDIELGTEESFTKNFSRKQKMILNKYGVHLSKVGRRPNISYYIEEEEYFLLNSFIDEESENRSLTLPEFNLINLEFHLMLVILFAPMGVFRGTLRALANYAGVEFNNDIFLAIEALQEKDMIIRTIDDSTEERIYILSIKRDIEQKCAVKIDLHGLRICMGVAQKNNNRS